MLIKGREKAVIKKWKTSKVLIDYSRTIDDVNENSEDFNPTTKRKLLIIFDFIIVDMESNKKLSPTVTELFLRRRKLNILLVFKWESYFKFFSTTRPNGTYYFIMKTPYKRELQQATSSHLSKIDFQNLIKLYIEYTKEPYSVLVNNTTFSSDSQLIFRKNLL